MLVSMSSSYWPHIRKGRVKKTSVFLFQQTKTIIIERCYVLSTFSHLLLVVNSSANIVVCCWKVRDRFTPERSVLLTIPMGISSVTHLSHKTIKNTFEFLQHTFASRTGNSEVPSWQFWAVRKYFLFPSLLGGNQVFLEKSTRKYTVQFSSQW